MNKAILIGNVGKDPEAKTFDSGKTKVTFSLATSDGYCENKKTNWHNVVLWGKAAETARDYVKKGNSIAVEGRIEYREYEQDGTKKYITEIIADSWEFVGTKPKRPETHRETHS